MPRIALLVEYNGKRFHGSQNQLGLRTVQSELEEALTTLARQKVGVVFSGRTDAGVHSLGQVAHLDWPHEVIDADELEKDKGQGSGLKHGEPLEQARELPSGQERKFEPKPERKLEPMPLKVVEQNPEILSHRADFKYDLWRIGWALNGIMKKDISIGHLQVVDESFHARFSAIQREYVYRILNRPQRSCLLNDTHYFVPRPLELKAMQDGASRFLGRHDFTSFRTVNSDKSSPVCTVTRSEILQLGDGRLEFWIAADHFVYNMVRIIAGTLTEIGLGKRTLESLETALEKGDRDLSGPTAPPGGLTLHSVRYPENYNLFERDTFDEQG